jgi:hypothetical protein
MALWVPRPWTAAERASGYPWAYPAHTQGRRKNERGGFDLIDAGAAISLTRCSRKIRIAALRRFPALARQMKREVDIALKAIDEAKQFVK